MRLKFKSKGITLVEMIMAMVLVLIPIFVVGQVLTAAYRGSENQRQSVYNQMRDDAQNFTIKFGITGRKSNKKQYNLYVVNDDTFTLSQATNNQGQNVKGDAVEFIYWKDGFTTENAQTLMDANFKGTNYVLFYPEDGKLKADYGSYPPSAILNGSTREPDRTEIIIENLKSVEFTHKTESKIGKGCVRATAVIENPDTGEEIKIKAAAFLRNVWPK